MSFHHRVLILLYPILQKITNLATKFGFSNPNRLRVLIFHDIPESEHYSFTKLLNTLQKNWNIINPSQFESMMSGQVLIKGNNLLITFDDGLISNRIVADKILKPLGIKAIFFVISDFVAIKNTQQARQFIANHIIPGSKLSDIPNNWTNMQWNDLRFLINQGHTIGCHTKKHTRLSSCATLKELEEEIVISANVISNKLNININHFAYTFGDINSINKQAIDIARHHYHYVYSGLRGNNSNQTSPFAVRRDAVAFQLKNNQYVLFNSKLTKVLLNGFGDFQYKAARKIIDSWTRA